jgi:hypothetical protein
MSIETRSRLFFANRSSELTRSGSAGVLKGAVIVLAIVMLLGARAASTAPPAPKPLTNEDIVTMVQAGLPQDVVVEKIKTSKTAFDTSTEALVALKKAGIGADIIRIMVNPAAEPKPAGGGSPFTNANAPVPCQVPPGGGTPAWLSGASPAMWYSEPDQSDRVELNYERGTITHVGFAGFGSSLLVLHPIKANARVTSRAQFLSCINPTDAPLVRFSLDNGSDERNTSVGKIRPWNISFHISEEDLVPYKSEKTPEGYFRITPASPLKPGEYGFVPQGSPGFFSAGERVYTFGVN